MANLENNHKIPLLYIAGTGRNGSTLMEKIFNEIPGFFTAGELGHSGAKLNNTRKKCICGEDLLACPVWGKIINDTDFKAIDQELLAQANQYNHGTIKIIKLLILKKIRRLPEGFKNYLSQLQVIYQTIHKHESDKIITDSTNLPFYGYFLSLIPSIDLYVVHLVRDPKGFAHSQNTVKYTSQGTPWNPKIPVLRSAFTWLNRNSFIELMLSGRKRRYLRVHYEELINNPAQTITKIGEMLNLQLDEHLSFIQGQKVLLGINHLAGANLNAIDDVGEVTLKKDERWKRDMKWWNIVLVTLITWPLLLKYFIVNKVIKKKRI